MDNVTMICIYGVLALLWLLLLLSGSKRFADLIEPLDAKEFPLKALFPVGFQLLSLIGYSYKSNADKKRLEQVKIVYGERFGEYFFRVNTAEKVTYGATCIMITPVLGPIFGEPLLCVFGLIAAGIAVYYADSKITDIIKEREEEIGRDLSDVVSKMALLINAGMITREAWEEIATTGKGTLYKEMRLSVTDMKNGAGEIDAYIAFATRCGVPEVKKFVSMLVQNISKGNKELVLFLRSETAICWEEKKHRVRRQGEEAANKLMLPLSMILIGVFIMILVPIITNLGM